VGVGLIIRQGGSSGGDDALALTISKLTGWNLARSYLLTDLTVLLLSLTYIPFLRIFFSLITVTLSSKLIDVIHGIGNFFCGMLIVPIAALLRMLERSSMQE
jgi:uncharacterized membrane-anchored protein YitT (DUF2179 family)